MESPTSTPPSPTRVDGRGAETRRRILTAAEELFAERGIDGVSLREITTAAGANSAAAHYHFGSKDAVLAELFQERARAIVERRLDLLARVPRDGRGAASAEDLLRAFLRPSLDVVAAPGGPAFMRLRARLAFEAAAVRREVLARAFDASSRTFLDELRLALPDVSVEDLRWRFHFTLGAMTYTMAAPGRIESITDGALDTTDDTALEQLVRYAAAGLRAP